MPGRSHGGGLSSAVILAAALVFVAELILNAGGFAVYSKSVSGLFFHYAVPAVMAALLLAGLRLSRDARASIALCLVAVIPALYGAEFVLGWEKDTRVHGGGDRRSKIEVISDLRAQGIDAYPVMRAKTLLLPASDGSLVPALTAEGKPFLPLASLPRKRVVSCIEGKAWLVYDSDRHGFHNPDGVWNAGSPSVAPPSLAIVGDSFAHGSCVPSDRNVAAHLRARHGAVINLGVSGFGPLSELASIKEYLEPMRPGVVLWFLFEGNDLTEDSAFERRSPLLMSYVDDPSFSQRLFVRAGEVSVLLKRYLDERLVEAMARFDRPHDRLLEFLTLENLRGRLGLDEVSLGVADPPDHDLLERALAAAKGLTGSWGGRLILVYLPDSSRYFAAGHNSLLLDDIRRRVLRTAQGLGLQVIDVHAAFALEKDTAALFQYPGSHYSEEGYRVVAEAIEAGLASSRR
ncbi:MAG: hypothetical protein HQL33_13245 [Alphaproteobacteria bacterium]|nr:hypothetical protein [Alphaproteobacteria bacterium]